MSKNIRAAVSLVAAGVLALSAWAAPAGAVTARRSRCPASRSWRPPTRASSRTSRGPTPARTSSPSRRTAPRATRAAPSWPAADADVVHYSLETDVTRLVKEGLVAEDWKDNATSGIATSSVVVFVVRQGNPEGIEGWDDLVEPGVEHHHAEPGLVRLRPLEHPRRLGARHRWHRRRGRRQDFITKLLNNVVALPGSGREATTAFTDGTGDVLLSYENEAIIARQNGADVDYIVPDDTLLIQNPAAVTTDARRRPSRSWIPDERRGRRPTTRRSASARSIDGVDVGEVEGANDPADPFPTPGTLYTIDDNFGGWGDGRRQVLRTARGPRDHHRAPAADGRSARVDHADARRRSPTGPRPHGGAGLDARDRLAHPSRAAPVSGLGIAVLWFSLLVLLPLVAVVVTAPRRRLGELPRTPAQRQTWPRAAHRQHSRSLVTARQRRDGHAHRLGAGPRPVLGQAAPRRDHRRPVRAADDRGRPGAARALRAAEPARPHWATPGSAVFLAFAFVTLPFVVRTVQPVLEELDADVEEAAASLGAEPAHDLPADHPARCSRRSPRARRWLRPGDRRVRLAGPAVGQPALSRPRSRPCGSCRFIENGNPRLRRASPRCCSPSRCS